MCPGLGSQTTTFGGLQAESSKKRISPFEKVHNFWGDIQLQKFQAVDAPAGGAASIFFWLQQFFAFWLFPAAKTLNSIGEPKKHPLFTGLQL